MLFAFPLHGWIHVRPSFLRASKSEPADQMLEVVVSSTYLNCIQLISIQPSRSKVWAYSWHSFGLPTVMNGMWAKALVLSSKSVWCPWGGHTQQLGTPIRAHMNVNFRNTWTEFAIGSNICRLNILKPRSDALENDNKAAPQVYKRDREPSRIRKAKLCQTMQKKSKRKGWKFLLKTISFNSSLVRTAFSMQGWNLRTMAP